MSTKVDNSDTKEKTNILSTEKVTGNLPLITKLSIRNFLCFKSLDVKSLNHTAIPYEGGEGEGKSAFIAAILLGLGYDVLIESIEIKTICGFRIDNVVRHKENKCMLETTISLQCCQDLMSVFGPYLTIKRAIYRDSKTLSPVLLTASDAEGNCFEPKRRVTLAELRLTLDLVGVNAKWLRLMLLDEANLAYLIHNPSEWFDLYEGALLITKRKMLKEFLETDLHIEKMEGDIRWRLLVDSHLHSELEKPYLIDSPMLIHDRDKNLNAMKQIRDAMRAIRSEIDSCRKVNAICQKELEELHASFHYNMSNIFRRFLKSQHLFGDILINLEKKQMTVWISNSKADIPKTLNEALALWERMPIMRKRLAVIGIYFALWQSNEICPIFLLDSYSTTATEFSLPEQAFSIFQQLLEAKSANPRTKHQQFFYTSKENTYTEMVEK